MTARETRDAITENARHPGETAKALAESGPVAADRITATAVHRTWDFPGAGKIGTADVIDAPTPETGYRVADLGTPVPTSSGRPEEPTDVGKLTGPQLATGSKFDAELRGRLERAVEQTLRRRATRTTQRQEFNARRAVGLDRRHTAKLNRGGNSRG